MQVAREGEDVGIPIIGLPGKRLHHDGFDPWPEIEVRSRLVERDRRLREELREHLPWTLGQIRQASGEKKIRDGGERVLVGCRRYQLPRQRLRRHVHQRSHEVAGSCQSLILTRIGRRCDSEIEQLGCLRLGIVHRVIGF